VDRDGWWRSGGRGTIADRRLRFVDRIPIRVNDANWRFALAAGRSGERGVNTPLTFTLHGDFVRYSVPWARR